MDRVDLALFLSVLNSRDKWLQRMKKNSIILPGQVFLVQSEAGSRFGLIELTLFIGLGGFGGEVS